jgi:hypothetical protein
MGFSAYGDTPSLRALIETLRGTGMRVDIASTPERLAASTAGWSVAHVVNRIPPALLEMPAAAAQQLILFIEGATDATEADLLELRHSPAAWVVTQGTLGPVDLQAAVERILDSTPGLDRYLPEGGERMHFTLTRSPERGNALGALQEFVAPVGLDARRVAQILTIADELISNAFYHAPVDGIGGHPFSHVSRMDIVETRPGREIHLTFGRTEHRVAVSIRDAYGSLQEQLLRTRLAKAATCATANFRASDGRGGAKLGLVTALRASSRLIFHLVPDQSAECIGIVETKGSYREFLAGGRSLHVFSGVATH